METGEAVNKEFANFGRSGLKFVRNGVTEDQSAAAFHQKKSGADNGRVFTKLEHLGSFGEVWMNGREDAEFAGHIVGLGGDGAHGGTAQNPFLCFTLY